MGEADACGNAGGLPAPFRERDDPRLALRVAAMPKADKFQLHIYAALAEQEREFISNRTKAALAEASARGLSLVG